MTNKQLIVGIDPDIDKSGVAVRNIELKTIYLYTLPFYDLVKWIEANMDNIRYIVVEASWLLQKSSFRIRAADSKQLASLKGKHVGWNQGVGRCIVSMIVGLGIECREQKPLKLRWGKDGKSKISHIELEKIGNFSSHTINVKRTNQEMRDACLLIM